MRSALGFQAGSADSPRGNLCLVGAKWMIIDIKGDVYSCHAGRWDPQGYMGNVGDPATRVRLGAQPCRYSHCDCPGQPIV